MRQAIRGDVRVCRRQKESVGRSVDIKAVAKATFQLTRFGGEFVRLENFVWHHDEFELKEVLW